MSSTHKEPCVPGSLAWFTAGQLPKRFDIDWLIIIIKLNCIPLIIIILTPFNQVNFKMYLKIERKTEWTPCTHHLTSTVVNSCSRPPWRTLKWGEGVCHWAWELKFKDSEFKTIWGYYTLTPIKHTNIHTQFTKTIPRAYVMCSGIFYSVLLHFAFKSYCSWWIEGAQFTVWGKCCFNESVMEKWNWMELNL